MDPLPLIPENERNHELEHCLREFFQHATCFNVFPRNLAQNLASNRLDAEHSTARGCALDSLKHEAAHSDTVAEISCAERQLMRIHAEGLVSEQLSNITLRRRDIYRQLSGRTVEMFSLLQKEDFLPGWIEQSLDFTLNAGLHTCQQPCPSYEKLRRVLRKLTVVKRKEELQTSFLAGFVFKSDVDPVVFSNYTLNCSYRRKIRMQNITCTPQSIFVCPLPKEGPFKVKILTNTSRIAPGMSAEFLLTFEPLVYQKYHQILHFKIPGAQHHSVELSGVRESPKLKCFVFDALKLSLSSVQKPEPGTQYFSERRCHALNMTIDCGSCLLGNYNVLSIVMKNVGERGEFFITTEKEWFLTELDDSPSREVELVQGCFSIFPVHFELGQNEIGEFFVLFAPNELGLFSEKIILLCDNNSHEEIELVGDCIPFQYQFINVDLYLTTDHTMIDNTHITVNLATRGSTTFLLAVQNKSPVHFEYYWGLSKDATIKYDKYFMDPDWLEIKRCTQSLPSNSQTDFHVTITAKTDSFGEFYTRISLYLKNVPIPSMVNYRQFVIRRGKTNHTDSGVCKCDHCCHTHSTVEIPEDSIHEVKFLDCPVSKADVHICQILISCSIRVAETYEVVKSLTERTTRAKRRKSKLKLSKSAMNFGLLPPGVEASQHISVINLTDDRIEWYMIECRIEPDMIIRTDRPMIDRLSHAHAFTRKYKKRQTLKYHFETDKKPVRWLSVLILLSECPKTSHLRMDSFCLVIYEVVRIQMQISTDTSPLPLLCPKELLYPNEHALHTIFVENLGSIAGCYYFLKGYTWTYVISILHFVKNTVHVFDKKIPATGRDRDKIELRYESQSGMVKPSCKISIKIELTPLESGVLDDFRIPCFVGDAEKLLTLNVVCVVADISVNFYLPRSDGKYTKILWPPDLRSDVFPQSQMAFGEYEDFHEEKSLSTLPSYQPNESLKCLIGWNSIAITYPTVELLQIPIKTPTKLTFYIENLTPNNAKISVEAVNFGPAEPCLNHCLVKTKTKVAREFWEKACLEGFGIVVDPETPNSEMIDYEVKEINLWIYANTWGKYLEEICVEIENLTPFCFNLYIEIQGLPLEFPFAINTIRKEPIYRIGTLNYYTGTCQRIIRVTNVSSIPVHVTWHMFERAQSKTKAPFNFIMELDDQQNSVFVLSDVNYGEEICPYAEIEPRDSQMKPQETVEIQLTLDLTNLIDFSANEKLELKYNLVGYIHLEQEEYKFKENYFKRTSGLSLEPVKLSMDGVVEVPELKFEFSRDDTRADVFVNDLLLGDVSDIKFYLVFKNPHATTVDFTAFVDPPFKLTRMRKCGVCVCDHVTLHHDECVQMVVKCRFDREELLKMAEFIYLDEEAQPRREITNLRNIVTRNLFLKHAGYVRQVVPLKVVLHFPKLEISPFFVKFGPCLLYDTKRTLFTINNLSGSRVPFEVYKTTESHDFELKPNHGEVPPNTGANKQFVDVLVYFTPQDCKKYVEIVRITTNIPHYYIDIPLMGYGSNNEKFHTV